jgi:hypothetical protein
MIINRSRNKSVGLWDTDAFFQATLGEDCIWYTGQAISPLDGYVGCCTTCVTLW